MTNQSFRAQCVREVAGEYVTAGCTYTVTQGKKKTSGVHFQNDNGSATTVASWAFARAMADGSVVRI